jgi:hypothetical protein
LVFCSTKLFTEHENTQRFGLLFPQVEMIYDHCSAHIQLLEKALCLSLIVAVANG